MDIGNSKNFLGISLCTKPTSKLTQFQATLLPEKWSNVSVHWPTYSVGILIIQEFWNDIWWIISVLMNVRGKEETTQASHVLTHMLGMNTSLNTLDVRLYISTNKYKYSLCEHM